MKKKNENFDALDQEIYYNKPVYQKLSSNPANSFLEKQNYGQILQNQVFFLTEIIFIDISFEKKDQAKANEGSRDKI